MTDSEFLNWLADRLVHVYGESPNVDFVTKLRNIAKEQREDKVDYTRLASKHNERCELCLHFIEPEECTLVQGIISPKGWCKLFERKK